MTFCAFLGIEVTGFTVFFFYGIGKGVTEKRLREHWFKEASFLFFVWCSTSEFVTGAVVIWVIPCVFTGGTFYSSVLFFLTFITFFWTNYWRYIFISIRVFVIFFFFFYYAVIFISYTGYTGICTFYTVIVLGYTAEISIFTFTTIIVFS